MSRVTDLLKGAVELNLRYTSTLLHLSKDYLKDANEVLSRPAPAPAPTPAPDAPAPERPPLLVVGRAGETANAAFAINNPTDKDMAVHLVVQGDVGDRVGVDPARFTLKAGAGTIVRILARIDERLEAERDHVGSVVAPGLASQGVPFIVRRIADAVPATPSEPADPKAPKAAPTSGGAARRARAARPAS